MEGEAAVAQMLDSLIGFGVLTCKEIQGTEEINSELIVTRKARTRPNTYMIQVTKTKTNLEGCGHRRRRIRCLLRCTTKSSESCMGDQKRALEVSMTLMLTVHVLGDFTQPILFLFFSRLATLVLGLACRDLQKVKITELYIADLNYRHVPDCN